MPGNATNGMVVIGPSIVNGVTQPLPVGVVSLPTATMRVAVDTGAPAGGEATVAATLFQLAAGVADLIVNGATSTAGAATLNTEAGLITTEALTTAPGATYTFVLTNSLITATGPIPQVVIKNKTNTTSSMALTSVATAAGSATFVFTNTGTAALNGTKLIAFHL